MNNRVHSKLETNVWNPNYLVKWPFPGPDKKHDETSQWKLQNCLILSIEDKFLKIIFLQVHCGYSKIWAHFLLDHKKILLLEN